MYCLKRTVSYYGVIIPNQTLYFTHYIPDLFYGGKNEETDVVAIT